MERFLVSDFLVSPAAKRWFLGASIDFAAWSLDFKLVPLHQLKFGRQTTCKVIAGHRVWIWDRISYSVWVTPMISQVRVPKISEQGALSALKLYYEDMGFVPERAELFGGVSGRNV